LEEAQWEARATGELGISVFWKAIADVRQRWSVTHSYLRGRVAMWKARFDTSKCSAIEVKPRSALVRVTLSEPKGDGLVKEGDLVTLHARAPKMEKRSLLWSLARYHIGILNGDGKKEYVDYRKLYKEEAPQVVDGVEQEMLKEIHGIPGQLDAKAAGAKLEKGSFAGKTVAEALAGVQKSHLETFLGFLLKNRSYFAGHNYFLPRVFRAWVEAGAPAE
jgi:hypothetical protein